MLIVTLRHDVAIRTGYGQPIFQNVGTWNTALALYSKAYMCNELCIEPKPNGAFDNPVRIDEPLSSDEDIDSDGEELAFRLGNLV